MKSAIVIGTRGSDLALWQAHYTQKQLTNLGYKVLIKVIKTKGDVIQDLSFDKTEGKGFFTKELEEALLSREIDIAVHSHKDLPTTMHEMLSIAAVSYRANPQDVMIIHHTAVDTSELWDLKYKAKVGTSSSRRTQQLRLWREDIICHDLRGNVPTRIQKLRNAEYDAIILAAAGIERLQIAMNDMHIITLPIPYIVPAASQGVLAYQIHKNNVTLHNILSKLNHIDVQNCIAIERKILHQLEGGCQLAIGVNTDYIQNQYHTTAYLFKDGMHRRATFKGQNKNDHEEAILKQLLQPISNKTIFISRDICPDSIFNKVIRAKVLAQSLIDFRPIAFDIPHNFTAIFFTSKNCVNFYYQKIKLIAPQIKIYAAGNGTRMLIKKLFNLIQDIYLWNEVAINNEIIIFPIATHSLNTFQDKLVSTNQVINIKVYNNTPKLKMTLPKHDIAMITSPMNAQVYATLQSNKKNAIVASGDTTAATLRQLGFDNVIVAPRSSELDWADTLNTLL